MPCPALFWVRTYEGRGSFNPSNQPVGSLRMPLACYGYSWSAEQRAVGEIVTPTVRA